MSQSEDFVQQTPKKLTLSDIAQMFTDLDKSLNVETYSFETNLIRPEGGNAVGFAYVGYNAGAGLRQILRTIKIDYAVVMRGGTGINENSEIQIEDTHEKKMLDLMNNLKKYKSAQNVK